MREVFDHCDAPATSAIAAALGRQNDKQTSLLVAATPQGAVVTHPSAALYEQVRNTVLPAVEVIAERKNVPMADEERNAVIDHALAALSRRTLRGIMSCEPIAIERMQLALDHAIDRLAANRFAWTIMRLRGDLEPDPTAMIAMADETLARRSANDQAASMRIWPDLVAGLAEAITRIANQEATPPLLTMPENAESRVVVQTLGRPRRKGGS